jgi:hypothetical protein
MNTIISIALILGMFSMPQSTPDADAILKKVDANMTSKTLVSTSEMVIYGRRNSRTITAKGYAEGDKKSFSEYLSRFADSGTDQLQRR